jgi:hypothetical protein
MYKKNIYFQFILISSGGPLLLNDFSQAPGHRRHQLLEVVAIAHPGLPELDNLSLHSSMLEQEVSLSLNFIQAHTFSMGLRSGELPGHLMSWMCGRSANHWVTILALWHDSCGMILALWLEESGSFRACA